MKILVASDTHGRRDRIHALLELHRNTDAFLFLGDGIADLSEVEEAMESKIFAAVRGNCDRSFLADRYGANRWSEELFLCLDEYHILMMHGHTQGVKSDPEKAICYAAQRGADILLYGHTHRASEEYFPAGSILCNGTELPKPLYVMNPGSLGEPRYGAPSYGVIEMRGKNLLLSHGTL